jgi:hypothetical protein
VDETPGDLAADGTETTEVTAEADEAEVAAAASESDGGA